MKQELEQFIRAEAKKLNATIPFINHDFLAGANLLLPLLLDAIEIVENHHERCAYGYDADEFLTKIRVKMREVVE